MQYKGQGKAVWFGELRNGCTVSSLTLTIPSLEKDERFGELRNGFSKFLRNKSVFFLLCYFKNIFSCYSNLCNKHVANYYFCVL